MSAVESQDGANGGAGSDWLRGVVDCLCGCVHVSVAFHGRNADPFDAAPCPAVSCISHRQESRVCGEAIKTGASLSVSLATARPTTWPKHRPNMAASQDGLQIVSCYSTTNRGGALFRTASTSQKAEGLTTTTWARSNYLITQYSVLRTPWAVSTNPPDRPPSILC